MLLEYFIRLGDPCGNRVVYDGRTGYLNTERSEEEELCFLVSPDMRLRVSVNVGSGDIVGLEYNAGRLGSLPAASLRAADYTQGAVSVKWSKGKLIESCSYLISADWAVKYDCETSTVLLGEYCDGGLTVRIAANLFAIIGADYSLRGFLVCL